MCESMETEPPARSTAFFTSDRPRPVPPLTRDRPVDTVEPLEDPLEVVLGDADPRVADGDDHLVAVGGHAHIHRSSLRVHDGVGEQVVQHDRQVCGVHGDRDILALYGRQVSCQFKAALGSRTAVGGYRQVDGASYVGHGLGAGPLLHAREIEQV